MITSKNKINYNARDDINKTKNVVLGFLRRVTRNGLGIVLININKIIKKIYDKI